MMASSDTSYFTLRPCDKQIGLTDPKPEPREQSSSATTSSMETGYLHDLGLPSLPPLSQLLTTDDKTANASSVTAPLPTPVIRALVEAQQQQQEYFSAVTTSSSPSSTAATSSVHTSLPSTHESSLSIAPSAASAMPDSLGLMATASTMPTTTAPLTMLMDPTSAAAAAMYLPPTQDGLGDTSNPAVAAAALLASNPMLPVTTANPSSFYNIAPSVTTNATTTTSPIDTTSSALSPPNNDPNTADMASSFMMPPNSMDPRDSMEKNYSFVAIPGANQRKRPRRRYDEIERLYHCTWPNCTKSYGTLNHLNAHVSMQKHGAKRHPSEFKEMRKNWRRQKKEREAARKASEKENLASSNMVSAMSVNMATGTTAPTGNHLQHPPMMPTSLQSYNTYAPFPSIYTSLPQSMASIGAFY